jgi:hypothetical protein
MHRTRGAVVNAKAAAERHAVRSNTHRRQLGATPLLIAELLVGAQQLSRPQHDHLGRVSARMLCRQTRCRVVPNGRCRDVLR